MQIFDNGVMRDMTEEEEYLANHMPDPSEQVSDSEALSILLGGAV